MERDVMDIVKEKEFIELTAAERAELGELCSSEDEFNQVKGMFAGIAAMDWSNPTPKAETKESLDHLFAQKYAKAAPVWYNAPLAILAPKGKPFYRQPLVQAAAVGLLIFLAYPFVNSSVLDSKTNQVAVLEKDDESTELKNDEKKTEEKVEDVVGNATDENESPIETRNGVVENRRDVISSDPTSQAKVASVSAAPGPNNEFRWGTESRELNEKEILASSTAGSGAAKPGSDHPDGIFIGDKTEIFSVPASREPAVFDLLTSTF